MYKAIECRKPLLNISYLKILIFLPDTIVDQNKESGRYFVATRKIGKVRSYYYNIEIDIDYFNDIYFLYCTGGNNSE